MTKDIKKEALGAAGDDLDDGLEYDFEAEDVLQDLDEINTFSDDAGDFQFSDNEKPSASSKKQNDQLKRNRDNIGDNVESSNSGSKKRKQNDSLKQKKKLKMEMDMERKKQLSVDPLTESISDWVNQRIRQKNPDLSALELADLYLDKTVFRATGDFKETRNLDNLEQFIKSKFDNMLPSEKEKGKKNKNKNKNKMKKNKNGRFEDPEKESTDDVEDRKFVCLLSMSALRACDVHRATRDLPGSSLKLINKNKLEVDLKLVGTTKSRVLCATPGRLEKVLKTENSGLKPEEIKIIILDNSYLDQKMQNIWDISETLKVLKDLSKSGLKVYLY